MPVVLAMNSLRPRLGPDPVQSRAELSRGEELDGAGFVPSLVALYCPSVPSPCAIHYKFSLWLFLLLFFLSCTQIVTAIAKPPTDPTPLPLISSGCTLLQFVLLGHWEANSNMGQTHSRHIKCSAGQHRANHNNIPNAQVPMLSSTLSSPFPCCSSSSSSTAACNARNLSSTISVCGFCWDSLLICPANATPSPRLGLHI